MDDDRKTGAPPLSEDREGPLADKGWHGGATFFEEAGETRTEAAGAGGARDQGAGGSDPHLPASEAGTGIIPEDEGSGAGSGDVHRPASEADTEALDHEKGDEAQAWPGSSYGTFPPPG